MRSSTRDGLAHARRGARTPRCRCRSGRWTPAPRAVAQLLGVGEVAVVADGERAARVVDGEGLGVLDVRAAGGGVAHVADGDAPGSARQLVLREGVLHEAHRAVGVELLAVGGDDAGRLLPAVLERVQPEVGEVGRLGVAEDAEDAAHARASVAPAARRRQTSSGRSSSDGWPSEVGQALSRRWPRRGRWRSRQSCSARAGGRPLQGHALERAAHRGEHARRALRSCTERPARGRLTLTLWREKLTSATYSMVPPPAAPGTHVAAWLMALERACSTGARRSHGSGAVFFEPAVLAGQTYARPRATPARGPGLGERRRGGRRR